MICLALPAAYETTSFGHPTFRAGRTGKKTFAVFENYRGEDTICVKATLEDQALLVLDPRFFVAPHVGKHGWTPMGTAGGAEEEAGGEDEEALVFEPRFFVAPYVGKHGWTSMRTAGAIDWTEVEEA